MAALTLRSTKGAPLTNAELDGNFSALNTELQGKQAALESGVSIKSINGASLLGGGDIAVDGGAVISETAPANPTVGKLWWNSATGSLSISYFDGNTTQWVEAVPTGASAPTVQVGGSSVFTNAYALSGVTYDGAETEIFVDGVANARIPVTANKTVYFLIEITGRRTDGSTMESVVISQRCAAMNNAGTTGDLGNITETILFRSDTNFNADARASDATDSLNIYVQGAAGKTMSWKVVVQTVEI